MTEMVIRVEPAPVFDIDPAQIGMALMILIGESANLGHERPQYTLGYGAPEMESPAAQFVRDTFELTTEEIADKWFGGRLNAARLPSQIVGAMLAPYGLRKGPPPAA